ncbi:aquaporin-10 isoform 1-T1 [Anomaloglossus baeobatrachus]|uniref:aquaporin-10 n=1 Tax=Anomaloglossus baeobatrachus TaxID=238106 RepID=UPI003F50C0FD
MNMASWYFWEWAHKYLRLRNIVLRECLAEFLGVFVLLFITTAAVAQGVTSSETKGNFFCMYLAGAIAVVIAIYVSGGVSGGHLNPAYSLSLCVLGRFPWRKLPLYFLIQLLGSFTGAAATFALYYDAIQHYSRGNLTVYGPRETASIFSTYPAPYLSIRNGFLDQVMGTAMLMIGILAVCDPKNKPVPKGLEPIVIGMLVFSIGLSMGANCGYPINPSRDLGPRIFTCVAGWGADVFRAGNNWWWVPVVAPCVGGLLGSFIYQLLVAIHHPVENTDNEQVMKGVPPEKWREIPVYTINMDNSLSHQL